MIDIKSKYNCTGCGACYNKCPKKCIDMIEDTEGFLYPVIRKELCVNCNSCSLVCPILQKSVEQPDNQPEVFLAYSYDEEIRKNSSSGGIFFEIARYILNSGGVVFGCSFDSEFLVHHIGIDSIEQLCQLVGSKYLQSRTEKTYKEVKELLVEHKPALYVGTACQIAGLKKYLGKEYEELYTVDILCHGVVTPKLWRKYLDELEYKYNSKVEEISFRNKYYGWKKFSLCIRFNNNHEYMKTFSKDKYMQMFLSNICLRPSCYACKFKGIPHEADITIGDAWGVQIHSPEMDDDKGTSVLITNTTKGRILFNSIAQRIRTKEMELDIALPTSADSRKSVKESIKRERFFELLNDDVSIKRLFVLSRKPFIERFKSETYINLKKIIKFLLKRFNLSN